jgi:hypothetical protein
MSGQRADALAGAQTGAARPPPSLAAIAAELDLGALFWGALSVAGLIIGLAFLGLGTEVFIGERGQFSGAGATAIWTPR